MKNKVLCIQFLRKSILLISVMIIVSNIAVAQDSIQPKRISPSIPIELMAGNNRLVFQLIINKYFSPKTKFGFFSVSALAADYKNERTNNDFLNIALLNYEIVKGFKVAAGIAANSTWGFRPMAGLQYIFANPKFLVVIMPSFYLTETHNFEPLVILEYKPKLKNNWSLYSRLQGLYSHNLSTNKHDRSYGNARLGVSYKKFGFGFATNLDWYGPMKIFKQNYGIFLRTSL